MEEAADRIRSVVKNLLPERPHHLSLYPDRKYQVPPNFWQHQSPLQYSTFVSDADRGVLLTRPYFDICDEPEPNSTPLGAVRNGPKKTLNKMSFKDYKKQKEKASTSPTENGVPGKPDKYRTDVAMKLDREHVRKELDRPGAQQDTKVQESRVNGDVERSKSSTSKPFSRDASSPSDSKKRPLEPDDGFRQHKKSKPSDSASVKMPRPETPRSREHNAIHDKSLGREGRPGASQLTPGARAVTGSSRERDRAVSPRVTVQSVRSQHSLPKKTETSSKHLVPPLLSPLRHPAIDDELDSNTPRKRPKESTASGKIQTKTPKSDVVFKKAKPTIPDLPALLSPTLPALVEDELERFEKASYKGEPSQPACHTPETSKSARKSQIREIAEDEHHPRRYIVTLKIKKPLRGTVKRLLALPSKAKKERSASVDNTPPPAKKRPRPAESIIDAAPAVPSKRSKIIEAPAAKAPAPYTPPNPPAASSLPGSSQTQTPSGRVAATPTAGDASSAGRPGVSKDVLMRRQGELATVGRKLKRERDREKQEREKEKQKQPNGAPPNGDRMTADEYRPAMMTMEMILAYFIAFRSGNQASELSRVPADEKAWVTLEAHLGELKRMTSHYLPLYTLAAQLNGILINEILRACSTHGTLSALDDSSQKALMRNLSNQYRVWPEVEKLRGRLTDERLKTPAMGPWTSAYKAVADTLFVMGRIAERENVSWRAEVVAPKE